MQRGKRGECIMKKRIYRSLGILVFLICIIFAAKPEEKHTDYVSDSPRAGVTDFIDWEAVNKVSVQETEVEVVSAPEPEVPTVYDTELYSSYIRMGFTEEQFNDDIVLLAAITVAEAGNQSELGKRLVIDTVLNRIDSDQWRDDDTIWETIAHPGQYTSYIHGCHENVIVEEEVLYLVKEEIINRTNADVIYFKTDGYFSGCPEITNEGDHFFSGNYNWE